MNNVHVDIEMEIDRAGLSKKASREILGILNDASEKIPSYKAVQLLKFLDSLRTDRFLIFTSKKKAFLENLIELLKQNDGNVSRICHLFFDQAYPKKGSKYLLPEKMVRKLTTAGRIERVESVKAIIWDLLWRQGGQLARLVSPEDLIFALWLDDPLTRNKLIMFMFRHFDADRVIEAICKYTSNTGKRIPSNVSRQFIGLARAETELKHKSRLLSNILERSHLTNEEINRIWADYLKSRSRFELIKIFSSSSEALGWIGDLKGSRGQLSFNFRPTRDISFMTGWFASRVHAIRARVK